MFFIFSFQTQKFCGSGCSGHKEINTELLEAESVSAVTQSVWHFLNENDRALEESGLQRVPKYALISLERVSETVRIHMDEVDGEIVSREGGTE